MLRGTFIIIITLLTCSTLNHFKMQSRLQYLFVVCMIVLQCDLMGSCNKVNETNTNINNTTSSGTSPLAKFVLLFSQPGAFARETKVLLGDDLLSNATEPPCPPGDEGLTCRRLEARRSTHECSGGSGCLSCLECDESRAAEWPRCCKKHFLCCSNLAVACQRCDRPELAAFCAKRFKRCFE